MQIKLLELEKSSIQSNLDEVLELATQQKASFSEKYEEVNDSRVWQLKFIFPTYHIHLESYINTCKIVSLAYHMHFIIYEDYNWLFKWDYAIFFLLANYLGENTQCEALHKIGSEIYLFPILLMLY
jgi:hypothetical protein